jgi:P-loop containing dynein motor region
MLKTLAPLRPILFVGESGTAKTTVIQKYLDGLESSVSTKLNINFSSNTTAADVQTNIECNVDRRSGMCDVLCYLHVMLHYVMLCYVMLRCIMLRYAVLYWTR